MKQKANFNEQHYLAHRVHTTYDMCICVYVLLNNSIIHIGTRRTIWTNFL